LRNLILIGVYLLLLVSCGERERDEKAEKENIIDLPQIEKRGKIIALTAYNAYSYFIYKGRPMGFEYELANLFAEQHGLKVDFKVVNSIDGMFDKLNSGEGDFIAFNLTVTKERKEKVAFTHHHNITHQVLVQRRPENWRSMMRHQIEDQLIRNPLELDGKTIHVIQSSSYLERLANLEEEIGGHFNIVVHEGDTTTDDLIELVAEGEIDYTIADENLALLNQAYYSNLDVGTSVSLPQKIAWAVRKNSPALLDSINSWIDRMRKNVDYYTIYQRYYENRSAYRRRLKSEFFSNTGGKISEYDDLLKEYSKKLDWDWRIIASLIYQESQFDPSARSWAGAIGLMQLLPTTAEQYGVIDLEDPHQNLKAGFNYLLWLDDFWEEKIPEKTERIKFVLASYNIGLGHIMDARKLAGKYGADQNTWFGNVETYLLKKSQKKYYTDEVVRNGYSSGKETVKYVEEILDRYDHYKKFII
jgi:membrane-bound lytic murein transglycosylase F